MEDTMAASSGGVEWSSVLKPLLSLQYDQFNRKEIIELCSTIIKCEAEILRHKETNRKFYNNFVVLSADFISNCANKLSVSQIDTVVSAACRVLLRHLISCLQSFASDSNLDGERVNVYLNAVRALCTGIRAASLSRAEVSSLVDDMKGENLLPQQVNTPPQGAEKDNAGSNKQETTKNRSDLSMDIFEQLTLPLRDDGHTMTLDHGTGGGSGSSQQQQSNLPAAVADAAGGSSSDPTSEINKLFLKTNTESLQALRAGDALVDLCLNLQAIKRARTKVEEALAGKPFSIPTNQAEATVLKNCIQSNLSEIKLALSAIGLPVLEPLTPSKLDKLSALSMAVLYIAVCQAAANAVLSQATPSSVVSPKCSSQQQQIIKEDESSENNAVAVVEEALNMYSYIGTTIKNSTRAGGHVYQNHLLAGAWVLVSGLQAHLNASTTPTTTAVSAQLAPEKTSSASALASSAAPSSGGGSSTVVVATSAVSGAAAGGAPAITTPAVVPPSTGGGVPGTGAAHAHLRGGPERVVAVAAPATDDKGRSPCKSRDSGSAAARSGLQKFQHSFGVLSVAIATKALSLLTELFEDLHLEACGGGPASTLPQSIEPAPLAIMGQFTALQRVIRVLNAAPLNYCLFTLAIVSYGKAGTLKRLDPPPEGGAAAAAADTFSQSDSTTYYDDMIMVSDESSIDDDDDSEPILGQWFEETLAPPDTTENKTPSATEGNADGNRTGNAGTGGPGSNSNQGHHNATADGAAADGGGVAGSNSIIPEKGEAHGYVALATEIFVFLNRHFLCTKSPHVARYVKLGLTEHQMMILAAIIRDLDRETSRTETGAIPACFGTTLGQLYCDFSGALTRFTHNLVTNTNLNALQACLLNHLGVSPWNTDVPHAWPLQVYPRTLSVLAQVLLLRPQNEKEASVISIWHRLVNTLIENVLNTSQATSDSYNEDLNVEHAQVLLYLFHSLNLMQKKSVLLLLAGGVSRCSEVARGQLLKDSQLLHLSRLLLLFDYIMKHLYDAPTSLLEQIQWNLFYSTSLNATTEKDKECLNRKYTTWQEIEDNYRKISTNLTEFSMKPRFYVLTTAETNNQDAPKLDGLACNFILGTQEKLRYPLLLDALIEILNVTQAASGPNSAKMTYLGLCTTQYCFTICWRLLQLLPPSVSYMERLTTGESPPVGPMMLHSLVWGPRTAQKNFNRWLKDCLVKQGLYTQHTDKLLKAVSDNVNSLKYDVNQAKTSIMALTPPEFNKPGPVLTRDGLPPLWHLCLLDCLLGKVQVGLEEAESTTGSASSGNVATDSATAGASSGTTSSSSSSEASAYVQDLFPHVLKLTQSILHCTRWSILHTIVEQSESGGTKCTPQNFENLQDVLAISSTRNPLINTLSSELTSLLPSIVSSVQQQWNNSVLEDLSSTPYQSDVIPSESYILKIVETHISTLSMSYPFNINLSLRRFLQACVKFVCDHAPKIENTDTKNRAIEILVAVTLDCRTEYLYDTVSKTLDKMIGDAETDEHQKRVYLQVLQHTYRLIINYTSSHETGASPTTSSCFNMTEQVLHNCLKFYERILEKSSGRQALECFFTGDKDLVKVLMSVSSPQMSQQYSTRVLQFFNKLFQAAEKSSTDPSLNYLCGSMSKLAQVDVDLLQTWLRHIIIGPNNVETATSATVTISKKGHSGNTAAEGKWTISRVAESGGSSSASNNDEHQQQRSLIQENSQLLQALTSFIVKQNSNVSEEVTLTILKALIPIGSQILSPALEGVGFTDLMNVMTMLADAGSGRGHALLFPATAEWVELCNKQVTSSSWQQQSQQQQSQAAAAPQKEQKEQNSDNKSGAEDGKNEELSSSGDAVTMATSGRSTSSSSYVVFEAGCCILDYISDVVNGMLSQSQASTFRPSSPPWEGETPLLVDFDSEFQEDLVNTVNGDEEDSGGEEDSDEDSLGNKLCTFTVTQKEFMNQHWYHCHTCRMLDGVGVCSVCARVCHKGHDLSYAKYGNFFCDCGAKEDNSCQALVKRSSHNSNNAVTVQQQQHNTDGVGPSTSQTDNTVASDHQLTSSSRRRASSPVTAATSQDKLGKYRLKHHSSCVKHLQDSKDFILDYLTSSDTIKTLIDFMNSLMSSVESACAQTSPVGCYSRAVKALQQLHAADKKYVHTDQLMLGTVGSQEGAFENVRISYAGEQGQTIRQLLSAHIIRRVAMCCMTSAHGRRQHLAVSHEKGKITVLQLSALLKQNDSATRKLTLSKLGSAPVPFTVLSLSSNLCNEDFLAVCGLKDCHVLTFTSSGSVSDHLVLHPQLETGNFIIKAVWLPGSQTQLALVTADFVKIYDLSKDALSPQYYFLVPSGKIRDCTFMYDDESSTYHILLMSSPGHIYTEILNEESSAKHGTFYVTNTLEVFHLDVTDINGQVAGGGVSIYYSHTLGLLFYSYAQGKSFVSPITPRNNCLTVVFPVTLPTPSSGGGGGGSGGTKSNGGGSSRNQTAQPLCQWTEIPNHPGLICCAMQSSNNPVILMLKPDAIYIQEVKTVPPKTKITDMVAIRHCSGSELRTTLMLLCEDGSLKMSIANMDQTGFWMSPSIQPGATSSGVGASSSFSSSVKTKKKKVLKSGGGKTSSSVSFPVDFFEHCQPMNEVEIGGNDLLQIYNVAQLKHRLNATGLYVACNKPLGFTVEITNPDANQVMVGIRVLVGSQEAARAPSFVEVFGRIISISTARSRWYDIPFSREESLQADKKLTVMFGPSQDPETLTMVDSIKVYGKTKDAFGWPEETEDTTTSSGNAATQPLSTVANVEETQNAANSPPTKLEKLVVGILEALDGAFSLQNSHQKPQQLQLLLQEDDKHKRSTLEIATRLLTMPTPPRIQVHSKALLASLHGNRQLYHNYKDQALLQHVLSSLNAMTENDSKEMDAESYYRLVLIVRGIAVTRPQNLVKFSDSHTSIQDVVLDDPLEPKAGTSKSANKGQQQHLLLKLMEVLWILHSLNPVNPYLAPVVVPGLKHTEQVIHALVEIVHAFNSCDTYSNITMAVYLQLLLCKDPAIAFSAKQALNKVLKPKTHRRKKVYIPNQPAGAGSNDEPADRGVNESSSGTKSGGPAGTVRQEDGSGGSNGAARQQQQQQQQHYEIQGAAAVEAVALLQQQQHHQGGAAAAALADNHNLNALEALLGGAAAAASGVGGAYQPLLDIPPDADDETMVELAIALSLQEHDLGGGGAAGGASAPTVAAGGLPQQQQQHHHHRTLTDEEVARQMLAQVAAAGQQGAAAVALLGGQPHHSRHGVVPQRTSQENPGAGGAGGHLSDTTASAVGSEEEEEEDDDEEEDEEDFNDEDDIDDDEDDLTSNAATDGSALRTPPAPEHEDMMAVAVAIGAGGGGGGGGAMAGASGSSAANSDSGGSAVESIGGDNAYGDNVQEAAVATVPVPITDSTAGANAAAGGGALGSAAAAVPGPTETSDPPNLVPSEAEDLTMETATTTATDSETSSRLHVLRLQLLERLTEYLPKLRNVSGTRAIPFLQVLLQLTSDLDGFAERDRNCFSSLLAAVFIELRTKRLAESADILQRTDQKEVQLLLMKLLSVFMGRTKNAGPWTVSPVPGSSKTFVVDNFNFVSRTTATFLHKANIIQYCNTLLTTLLKEWQKVPPEDADKSTTSSGGTMSGNLLKEHLTRSPPDMTPFFLKQFVKENGPDFFCTYPEVLTEMALRLPYQVHKHSEIGEPISVAFDSSWFKLLCEYMMTSQLPSIRRQVRKLLLFICGNKEKYRLHRDLHALNTHMKGVKECCLKGGYQPSVRSQHSLSLSYDNLVDLVEHLKACAEIAVNRTGNWQRFCLEQDRDVLALLVHVSCLLDEGVAPTILHLLQCAIAGGGKTGSSKSSTSQNTASAEPSSAGTTNRQSQQPASGGGGASSSSSQSNRKEREKSDDSATEALFEEANCAALVEQINRQVPEEVFARFIKTFMLETNTTSVRWQAHTLILAVYKNSKVAEQELILELLWRLWPQVPNYGRRASQFVDLLGYFSLKFFQNYYVVPHVGDYVDKAVGILRAQNRLLAHHPNANLYAHMSQFVELEGYYLESEPCLVCNNPEVPFANIKLSSLKVDSKFTTTTQIVKLLSSHVISKITVRIGDLKRTKMVRTINIYYNNRTVQAVVELKNKPALWHKAKKVNVASGQTEVKIEFPLPIVACNLMVEYADFYENIQASSETLQCPRCSAAVPANPGVCANCGENVFQCHKCRAINYDEKDPFLCHACGFCKYAKFDFTLLAKPCCAIEPIETDEDRKKTVANINSLLEKADRVYKQLIANKPTLENLVLKITEHGSDRKPDETSTTSGSTSGGGTTSTTSNQNASAAGGGGSGSGAAATGSASGSAAAAAAAPTSTSATISGGGKVNRTIQMLAQQYCNECKNSFEELSKIIQRVLVSRKELVAYDRKHRDMDYPKTTSAAAAATATQVLATAAAKASTSSSETFSSSSSSTSTTATTSQSSSTPATLNSPPQAPGVTSSRPPLSSSASSTALHQNTRCYGCSTAATEHCLTLLRALASNPVTRQILCSKGLIQELVWNNLRRGSTQIQEEVKQLLCVLTRDNLAATEELCGLLVDRITLSLNGHVNSCDLGTSVRHEISLLAAMVQKEDKCWELKLRCMMKLFLKACEDAKSPLVMESIILPCLKILQSLMKAPEVNAKKSKEKLSQPTFKQRISGTTVDVYKFLEKRSGHTFTDWKGKCPQKVEGTKELPTNKKEIREYYLCEKYAKRWRTRVKKSASRRRSSGILDLDDTAWLKSVLFNPSSRLARQVACNIVELMCNSSERKKQILILLTCFLEELGHAGESSAEFLNLYQNLIQEPPWKQFLTIHGVLSVLADLITAEIEQLHYLETTTLTSDLAQGYALNQLTELLASFLDDCAIRRQYKGRLVGAVLNGYLSLRRLVVQRTRLIDDTQEKLLDLLEDMTTGTEEETKSFMAVCIETVEKHNVQDILTPVFIFERLCSIIYPEENDVDEFFLILEKDPQQEDFLQGRMLGNPYSSAEAGLGPLMRDVKNKICQDCELVALLEDDNGMELLVNSKIISLDLPVKDVFKKIWVAEGGDHDAMRVVYRMRGLLGDATEEFIETLSNKSQSQVDNEEVYKMANVLADCDGLTVMVKRLEAIKNVWRAKPLLQVLLKLFRLCIKVSRCQEVLIQPELGAMEVFLRTLQMCLDGEPDPSQAAVTEQLLDIMETVLSKATSESPEKFEKFSLTFGGPEYVKSLLSCTTNHPSVKNNQAVLTHLTKVLAALVYGNEEKMRILTDHFKPVTDLNRYDLDHSVEDQQRLEMLCVLVNGIERNVIGNTLKDHIISLGIVKDFLEYITMHAPCVKPTLLRTDSDDLKDFISKPALKYCLRFLTGLAHSHENTQLAVASADTIIPIIHRLEQVSSDEHVGSLAENLLEALRTDREVARRIEEVREFTRSEKKRLAMAMREKQLGQLGMRTNDKGQVTAKSAILQQIEELGEETGLVCCICREGYKYQPTKVLGIYTFTKRCNVDDFEAKARRTAGYTTVSHFNVVHIDCHMSAVRLARARDEWESAALQNANTKCNGLLPLWGPQVPESAFASCLARHNTYLQESTNHRDIGHQSTMHDLKLLLMRFAQEKSFHEDTGGGGPQSNMHLIPYIVHIALYVINTTRVSKREESSLTAHLQCTNPEKWIESSYEADGPLYWCVMSLPLHSLQQWQNYRTAHLKRIVLLAQTRHCHPTGPNKVLTDKQVKEYAVYKPYLVLWGLVNGIYDHFFKNVTGSDEQWSHNLADFIRHNDETLMKASEKLLSHYTEELLPCASFAEFCDVTGLLDVITNPDTYISDLLKELP